MKGIACTERHHAANIRRRLKPFEVLSREHFFGITFSKFKASEIMNTASAMEPINRKKYLSDISHQLSRIKLRHTQQVSAVGLVDPQQWEIQRRCQLDKHPHH